MKYTGVRFRREEYTAALPAWEKVADVCAGQSAVKAKGVAYLPKPNPSDTSPDNAVRFEQYIARAVFYNATGRTLQGLVGAAFREDPVLQVPAVLEYVEQDVDGCGVSIYQQAQAALATVLKCGRFALLADYPRVAAPASRADMAAGRVRATLCAYEPRAVINWRTEKIGAVHKLTLVVLEEQAEEVAEDGFGLDAETQYRVLRYSADSGYTQEIWRKQGEQWAIAEVAFEILDGAGQRWDEIPFLFIGSQNNDPGVDAPPLYDLAELNLAHYRNSADYEDSVYLTGQPQFWIAGLSEEWRDWLQKRGLFVGARAPILLPVGGEFGIAQAQPNTLAKEAMDQKEGQMQALGARLLTPGEAVKTATQDQGEREAEHSVLSLCCSNTSEAYTRGLGWLARFMGAPSESIAFEVNQDFVEAKLDPAMLTALIAAWQSGRLPAGDLNAQLRKYGVIDPEKTDEEIDEELATQDPGLGLDDDDGEDTAAGGMNGGDG